MSIELAVSSVILALRPRPEGAQTSRTTDAPAKTLWTPLVRRIREPYQGSWALPGGPLGLECGLAQAARETLRRTTGLDPRYLEQLYCFGGLDRARGTSDPLPSAELVHGQVRPPRVVSIVYWALVRPEEDAAATPIDAAGGIDPVNVSWFPVDDLPDLAFDHREILTYALDRLRAKITYSPIAHAFLPDAFTLADLREVYESVLDRDIDPANFRRQMLARGHLEATGEKLTGASHRPPSLYRYRAQLVATSPTPPPRSAS
ncbi:NUDIX hydrolase [Serinibacter salmoneus]|uniref:NrtR DNA-binding winged helix domain-containing protein n=1 Tax=Serinibacter salmoneus TaxID=556530 RepID=A0A2A9CYJ6_9MICO|nr:NUDIX domain-containing protein [Serinibacter salmoneus]PFG19211.1 hypothetical protein ATL40_0768 [Serinibacter salmoneus]